MKIWKRLAALALCAALTSGTAFAANTVYRTITVQYSDIKLVVDGVKVTPKDADGITVEPFIYNGTTYLPVRAVGNAIGKQVTWDGKSKTVYLGEAPGSRTWLMDVCPPYETYIAFKTPSSFKMAGQAYTHGFTMNNASTKGCYALFNLNGNYNTLSCDIGHVDDTPMVDGQYEIYLDGDLAQIIEVKAEDLVRHFDIPLHNALQMKIVFVTNVYSGGAFGFANCELS
ncbi:MAG: stalk domain-containing protein [Agathobaculum desmolans]|uniref:stalk domain-containing protein n=1 Tax=Agathobaculum desmolans TaxID=39484 RepID=UPI003991A2A7